MLPCLSFDLPAPLFTGAAMHSACVCCIPAFPGLFGRTMLLLCLQSGWVCQLACAVCILITGLAAVAALLIRPACMSACAYALTSSCLHRSQGPRAWQAWLGPGWSLMYTLCPRLGPSLVWVPTLARVNIHPSIRGGVLWLCSSRCAGVWHMVVS